jgi:hypothetical protein
MYKMFGSCVVAVAFQSVFYLEMHQNNYFWYQRIKMIWKKKLKLKNLIFFKNAFETQKQTEYYETQLQKHVKTASQKLCFKLNFLVGPTVKNAVWCVTKHLTVFFALQTQKLQVNKRNQCVSKFSNFFYLINYKLWISIIPI